MGHNGSGRKSIAEWSRPKDRNKKGAIEGKEGREVGWTGMEHLGGMSGMNRLTSRNEKKKT